MPLLRNQCASAYQSGNLSHGCTSPAASPAPALQAGCDKHLQLAPGVLPPVPGIDNAPEKQQQATAAASSGNGTPSSKQPQQPQQPQQQQQGDEKKRHKQSSKDAQAQAQPGAGQRGQADSAGARSPEGEQAPLCRSGCKVPDCTDCKAARKGRNKDHLKGLFYMETLSEPDLPGLQADEVSDWQQQQQQQQQGARAETSPRSKSPTRRSPEGGQASRKTPGGKAAAAAAAAEGDSAGHISSGKGGKAQVQQEEYAAYRQQPSSRPQQQAGSPRDRPAGSPKEKYAAADRVAAMRMEEDLAESPVSRALAATVAGNLLCDTDTESEASYRTAKAGRHSTSLLCTVAQYCCSC